MKLIALSCITGSEKLLNDLEHRDNMAFFRLAEFRYEQDGCRQHAFCRIVEVCVLSERTCVHAGENNRLGDDLGVFLGFGFISKRVRVFCIQIHILIDQMQKVVAVRAHRIAQINNRNIISVVFRRNGTVVSHDVTLGIC